jgi:hypothetical protein
MQETFASDDHVRGERDGPDWISCTWYLSGVGVGLADVAVAAIRGAWNRRAS